MKVNGQHKGAKMVGILPTQVVHTFNSAGGRKVNNLETTFVSINGDPDMMDGIKKVSKKGQEKKTKIIKISNGVMLFLVLIAIMVTK